MSQNNGSPSCKRRRFDCSCDNENMDASTSEQPRAPETPHTSETRQTKELEARQSQEAETQQSGEAEAQQSQEAEARKSREAEAQQSQEAETRQSQEAETRQSQEAEARKSQEAEAQKSQEAVAQQSQEAETRQSQEAETRQLQEAETRQSQEAETRKSQEAETKQSQEAETRQSQEAETKQSQEAETRQSQEAETQQSQEAEAWQSQEAETQQSQEAEAWQSQEAETRQSQEAEAQKSQEAEAWQSQEAETQQSQEAEAWQSQEAETRQSQEAEAQQSQEAETQQSQEAETQQSQEAEAQQSQEAETWQSQEAETKQSQEAETQQSQEAEAQQSQEAETRKSQEAEAHQSQEAETQQSQEAETQQSQEAEDRQLNTEGTVQVSNQRSHRPSHNRAQAKDGSVYLQCISHHQRDLVRFNGVMHTHQFRFSNLDRIKSFEDAVSAVQSAIQTLLNESMADAEPGDFVQLMLGGGGDTFNEVFSTKQPREQFNAETFLNNIANALQSNAECLSSDLLKLTVIVIRNKRGGGRVTLTSIGHSQIIRRKKQWLYDFNNKSSKICLAASLYALLGNTNDARILEQAKQLHKDLGIPEDQMTSFSDIEKFEKPLGVTIKVVYFSNGKWQFYPTGPSSRKKTLYVLHHDSHYYGIKNIKSFLGEPYFCQMCHKTYHHKNVHSCPYSCMVCHRDDCVEANEAKDTQPRCQQCRISCRSQQCLQEHHRLATADGSLCRKKTFCESCERYVNNISIHTCSGVHCRVCDASISKAEEHVCYMQEYIPPKQTDNYIIYDFECMQETVIQEMVTQETRTQEMITQETRTQDMITQETGTQEMVTQEMVTQEMITQETRTQEMVTQEMGTQAMVTQETGTQAMVTQKTRTQETGTQETRTQETGAEKTGTHIPNYIYAKTLDGQSHWEFQGRTCVRDFVIHFNTSTFKSYTFIAHNAGRYDSYFILRELVKEKMPLRVVNQGGRLLEVTLVKSKIRFIDSLNFLPMKLSKLPEAMGFSEAKGFFPHFFNTEENQSYVGDMPCLEYYGVNYMMPSEKEKFMTWYEEHKRDTFNFQEKLKAYCKQDVEVLREACRRYREGIMEMTQKEVIPKCRGKSKKSQENPETRCIDPFQRMTLASVCMAMYKFISLPPETIAIVPGDNYHQTKKRFSTSAIQWLMYIEHTEGIKIQHALNGGEKKVGKYFLDGYGLVDGRHTAFEFQGCYYHGCPDCYDENDPNKRTKSTYKHLFQQLQHKNAYLKNLKYTVRELWEHQWIEMLESDKHLQEFLHMKQFPEPLDPRDALYGGRTNAIKLYHKAEEGETISYYDFTSLYPFINKTKAYPKGHPQILYENFASIEQYFGIARVKVYPPRELFFPVLPVKLNKKLLFPLCKTCASNSQTEPCTHSNDERSLTGTWCTEELRLAVQKGYEIAEIYEVWHFPEKTNDLFTSYVNQHLQYKQEASGYPSWCTDDTKKKQYIDSFYDKEGVQLRPEHIAKNPTKRQISKLFLNSLWGKFGQRSNLPSTSIVTDSDEFLNLVFSPIKEISEVNLIDDETAIVNWRYLKPHHKANKDTNIFIACFTTAYARLELYQLLDGLQERCFYHDTDSVIFVSKGGDWNPPLGDHLGELTSEVPEGAHITEFVSAGPKTYGYKLNTGQTVLKVKGITLNVANTQVINFEGLKDLVLDYPQNSDPLSQRSIGVKHPGIVRNMKRLQIETRVLRKTQRCVYTKRQLAPDFTTLPFGY